MWGFDFMDHYDHKRGVFVFRAVVWTKELKTSHWNQENLEKRFSLFLTFHGINNQRKKQLAD